MNFPNNCIFRPNAQKFSAGFIFSNVLVESQAYHENLLWSIKIPSMPDLNGRLISIICFGKCAFRIYFGSLVNNGILVRSDSSKLQWKKVDRLSKLHFNFSFHANIS